MNTVVALSKLPVVNRARGYCAAWYEQVRPRQGRGRVKRLAIAGTGASAAFWGWGLYVWLTGASAGSVAVAMAAAATLGFVTTALWLVAVFGRTVEVFQLGADTMYQAMADRDRGASVTSLRGAAGAR